MAGWRKGQSGNPRGRPKRTPDESQAAQEFISGCKRLLPKALRRIEQILDDEDEEAGAVLRVCELIAERVMGKPAQAITGTDGGPIIIRWQDEAK